MNSIIYGDFQSSNVALMDASSVLLLTSDSEFLTAKPSTNRTIREAVYTTPYLIRLGRKNVLDVLARLVLYDFVVVDVNALKSLGIQSNPFPDFVKTAEIPGDIYFQAGLRVAEYSSQLALHNVPSCLHGDEYLSDSNILWSGTDKEYLDYLVQADIPGVVASLAESNESVPRIIFYLELAKSASLPVLLSPGKRRWFDILAEHLIPEAFQLLEQTVDKVMREPIRKRLEAALHRSCNFSSPPLVDFIVRTARQESISLIESAISIRESKEAKEFRTLLNDVQRKLIHGESADLVEVNRTLDEIEKAAKKWSEHGLECGIEYEVRTMNLKAIPWIGWIFELCGLEKREIKDPLLTSPPSYLTFIANWYKY